MDFLAAKQLRFCVSAAGILGSIPDLGTRILHDAQCDLIN